MNANMFRNPLAFRPERCHVCEEMGETGHLFNAYPAIAEQLMVYFMTETVRRSHSPIVHGPDSICHEDTVERSVGSKIVVSDNV